MIGDGWLGYFGLDRLGYVHDRRSQRATRARGQDPGELLPAVHRIASLITRWLLGTHQRSTDADHLPAYMNEFVFRFNRRNSRSRGLVFYRVLQLAVDHDPRPVQGPHRHQTPGQDPANQPREATQPGTTPSRSSMAQS